MKILFTILVSFFILGCSASVPNINNGNNSEIEKLLAKKDKRIEELNSKIADLEAKKDKYQGDVQEYDNNPVLDELDELLGSSSDNNSSKE